MTRSGNKALLGPARIAAWFLGALVVSLWLAPTAFAQRPRVGLGIEPEPDSDGSGLAIKEVYANGPADLGWLRSGDVIMRINERSTPNRIEYRRIMGGLSIGDTAIVDYRRGKKKRTARLTVDNEPQSPGTKFGN